MMIEYRKGCLVEAARKGLVQAIGHGANCFCTMKSGIAPQITSLCPDLEEVDQDTVAGDREKLGTITYVHRDSMPNLAFNLYTQFHYGRDGKTYLDYEAIDSAMYLVNEEILQYNADHLLDRVTQIGFPKIGAGLAGGDWRRIAAIIEKRITSVTPVVYELEN